MAIRYEIGRIRRQIEHQTHLKAMAERNLKVLRDIEAELIAGLTTD